MVNNMSSFKKYQKFIILVNIIIIAFMYLFIGIKYPSLPDEIPNQIDFNGEVKGYTKKLNLFVIPILATVFFLILFALSYIPILLWKLLKSLDIVKEFKEAVNDAWIIYMIGTSISISALLVVVLICVIYTTFKVLPAVIILFALVIFGLNIIAPILFIIKLIPALKKGMSKPKIEI